mmetsp:Transcript_30992/g.77511  ORF Transcript_30992/g.77511 Transcript_30992/m.77511 type:complete len:259 (-) Transcript_30992:452-1228(-)
MGAAHGGTPYALGPSYFRHDGEASCAASHAPHARRAAMGLLRGKAPLRCAARLHLLQRAGDERRRAAQKARALPLCAAHDFYQLHGRRQAPPPARGKGLRGPPLVLRSPGGGPHLPARRPRAPLQPAQVLAHAAISSPPVLRGRALCPRSSPATPTQKCIRAGQHNRSAARAAATGVWPRSLLLPARWRLSRLLHVTPHLELPGRPCACTTAGCEAFAGALATRVVLPQQPAPPALHAHERRNARVGHRAGGGRGRHF